MQIGMVGAGRMGAGMVRRLLRAGHECHVFDLNSEAVQSLVAHGAKGAANIAALVSQMRAPRVVWLMLPIQFVEQTVEELSHLLEPGDLVIDGGNTHFRDDVRRAMALGSKGIHFVDVGTSGGVWGDERGYCLMVGGHRPSFDRLTPLLTSLAPGLGSVGRNPGSIGSVGPSEEGFTYCGPAGAGHFAKMVHNAIEYGMMQAFAEGFDLLKSADRLSLANGEKYAFNLPELAETWRRGSVISSWLLDLTAQALHEDPKLEAFSGRVDDTGEGRWALNAAVEAAVPAPVLSASLFARFRSRVETLFADKLLSAMRKKFGGHGERRA